MADDNNGRSYPEPPLRLAPFQGQLATTFIKGVIASGAAVSGAGYLFTLGGCSSGERAAPPAASSAC